MKTKIDDARIKMTAALKRLEASRFKTRVALANARREFFGALKTLENAVDAEFPLTPKPRDPPAPMHATSWLGLKRKIMAIAPSEWNADLMNGFVISQMEGQVPFVIEISKTPKGQETLKIHMEGWTDPAEVMSRDPRDWAAMVVRQLAIDQKMHGKVQKVTIQSQIRIANDFAAYLTNWDFENGVPEIPYG